MKKSNYRQQTNNEFIKNKQATSRCQKRLISSMMLFFFSAFLLVSFQEQIQIKGIVLAFLIPCMLYISTIWLPRFFRADSLILAITNFLCALGILVLYITDILADTNRSISQTINYCAGLVAMIICIYIIRYVKKWKFLMWLIIVIFSVLMILPLFIGKETFGAINWIYIAGISFQPSEYTKIALIFVTAYFMSKKQFFAWFGFTLFCLLALMLQRDLGAALIYFFTVLFLYYIAYGNLWVIGLGCIGGAGAAVMGYKMFEHVKNRVAIWINPWLYYEDTGYQIVQSLIAIASGGAFGVGLGLGSPLVIPAYFNDMIFAVICEQFGIIFGILVLIMYVILILRGTTIATNSQQRFYGLLAIGATVLLAMQTFVIIGGVLKFIPLTGITIPFISYGGSSLVTCMGLIGILQGVQSITQDNLTKQNY